MFDIVIYVRFIYMLDNSLDIYGRQFTTIYVRQFTGYMLDNSLEYVRQFTGYMLDNSLDTC